VIVVGVTVFTLYQSSATLQLPGPSQDEYELPDDRMDRSIEFISFDYHRKYTLLIVSLTLTHPHFIADGLSIHSMDCPVGQSRDLDKLHLSQTVLFPRLVDSRPRRRLAYVCILRHDWRLRHHHVRIPQI
jgi:hypothetical protein